MPPHNPTPDTDFVETPDGDAAAEPTCALAEEVESWTLHDALLATLVIFAAFYTIYFTRSILFPITLAVILNLVFKPIVLRMQRIGIPGALGATLVLLMLASAVGVGAWQLWEPASARVAQLTSQDYLNELSMKLKPLQEPLDGLKQASETFDDIASTDSENTPTKVQIQQPRMGNMLTATGGFLSSAVIALILFFFLMAGGDRFLEKLVELMPTFKDKRRVVELSKEVQHRISDYLFTISAINVGLGVAIGLGMWCIDMPNPVLWGVVGAVLNFIPFAGPAIGAAIVFMEGLMSFSSLGHAALAPAIYVGVNAIEANFITPAMLGKSISLNPVMIVLAIVFWGWLWGIGGVLLSVPLLVVLKICFDHSRTLAPVGAFMER